jgi:hypothetical protein
MSSTLSTASITPSASRSATLVPAWSFSANSAGTSSVIGIDQRAPLASRILAQTDS